VFTLFTPSFEGIFEVPLTTLIRFSLARPASLFALSLLTIFNLRFAISRLPITLLESTLAKVYQNKQL